MTLTRRNIADDFDATDEQIADLNTHKRQMLIDYRGQLAEAGMAKDEIKAEVDAVKKAIQRRRLISKDAAAVEAHEELVDEILTEITSRAPRATRARVEDTKSQPSDTTGLVAPSAGTGGDADRQPIPPSVPEPAAPHSSEAAAPSSDESAAPIPERPGSNHADPLRSDAATRKDAGTAAPEPTKRIPLADLPDGPDPRCLKPQICGRTSHIKLCQTCRIAAGLEQPNEAAA